MTCDILNTIGVEGLLAFSAVLLEVNLQHSNRVGRKWCQGQFFHFQILKANTLANQKNPKNASKQHENHSPNFSAQSNFDL